MAGLGSAGWSWSWWPSSVDSRFRFAVGPMDGDGWDGGGDGAASDGSTRPLGSATASAGDAMVTRSAMAAAIMQRREGGKVEVADGLVVFGVEDGGRGGRRGEAARWWVKLSRLAVAFSLASGGWLLLAGVRCGAAIVGSGQ